MDESDSAKYLKERYLSSPLAKLANSSVEQDSVPSEVVDFDALSLMPLGDATLLPEPDETIILYVATSIRRKYGMPSFCWRQSTLNPHIDVDSIPRGFVNNTSWRPALERPLLGLTETQRDAGAWGKDQFVVKVGDGTRKTVVNLVVNNLEKGDHPFHMVRISAVYRCYGSIV